VVGDGVAMGTSDGTIEFCCLGRLPLNRLVDEPSKMPEDSEGSKLFGSMDINVLEPFGFGEEITFVGTDDDMADEASKEVGNSSCEGRGVLRSGRDGLELGLVAGCQLKIFGLGKLADVDLGTVEGSRDGCGDTKNFERIEGK